MQVCVYYIYISKRASYGDEKGGWLGDDDLYIMMVMQSK